MRKFLQHQVSDVVMWDRKWINKEMEILLLSHAFLKQVPLEIIYMVQTVKLNISCLIVVFNILLKREKPQPFAFAC